MVAGRFVKVTLLGAMASSHGAAKVGEASQGEMRAEKLTIYFQSSTKSTSNKVNKLYLPALLFYYD
jgi:hypothetical protein